MADSYLFYPLWGSKNNNSWVLSHGDMKKQILIVVFWLLPDCVMSQLATGTFDCIEYFLSNHSRCLINIWTTKHISSVFKMKDESSGPALSWRQLSLHFLYRKTVVNWAQDTSYWGAGWLVQVLLCDSAECARYSNVFHITLNTLQSSVRSTEHLQNRSFRLLVCFESK